MQINQLRKLAEEIINKGNSELTNSSSTDIENTKMIVHELLVHQVELEMQNDEINQSRYEVEVSKKKYKKLFELAPMSYVVFDKEGKVIDFNNYFQQMFPSFRPTSEGKPFIVCVSEESQTDFYLFIDRVFKSEEAQTCKLKLKSGKKYFSAKITSERIEQEDPTLSDYSCLSIIEDIDLQEQTYENLKIAKENADRANQTKSMFLANMSHELRTPLNGILGINQLLLSNTTDDEVYKLLKTQQQASKNLLHIVDDILDYSKIEVGKLDLYKTEFNLRKFIDELIELYNPIAYQKNLFLLSAVSDKVPNDIYSDRFRLTQILTNLLGNAIKFTLSGGVKLEVFFIESESGEKIIKFDIIDTGIGIPEHLHDQLFREFSQIDNSYTKAFKGTGLGLALCKKLCTLMDANISFCSTEKKGSTFSLLFPYTVSKNSDHDKSSNNMENTTKSEDISKKKVLIVEDDELNRIILKEFLTSKGVSITEVYDGLQAINIYKDSTFDLVLMDIQLPNVDGLIAMQKMKSNKNPICNTPIIAMSAFAMHGDKENFIHQGFDDYISKPIDFNLLQQKIMYWVQK